ncbi:26515_t:CDS:2, partial [Racocetra persica]
SKKLWLEEEKKETSEYVTNSKKQALRKLLKPVFIPKKAILEKKRMQKLEDTKKLLELEERKKESHLMVAEIIQKEF